MGVVSRIEYRMKRFGETEEQARKMLALLDETDPDDTGGPDPEEE